MKCAVIKSSMALVLLSILFATAVQGQHGAGQSDFSEAIELLNHCVVPIVYVEIHPDRTFSYGIIEGTGFFVGKEGYFVTAGHVAQAVQSKAVPPSSVNSSLSTLPTPASVTTWGIVVPSVPSEHWLRGAELSQLVVRFDSQIIHVSEKHDLALCKATENPLQNQGTKNFAREVEFTESVPPSGTPVAFAGFPLQIKSPISASGTVSAYLFLPQLQDLVLLLDVTAWPGSSGSPVFTSSGKVFGVLTDSGTMQSSGLSVARPVASIRALFDEAGVPFPQASSAHGER
jgi:S1-C subfamily serine protease